MLVTQQPVLRRFWYAAMPMAERAPRFVSSLLRPSRSGRSMTSLTFRSVVCGSGEEGRLPATTACFRS